MGLKNVLEKKIEEHRPRIARLAKEFGEVKIDEVTVGQVIGGARSIKSLITDISYLDPLEGIRYRGLTIPQVMQQLPKPDGKDYPYVEGLWYFLLTGDIPTKQQAEEVVKDFKARAGLPQYVKNVLNALPEDTHPMTLFSTAVLSMQNSTRKGSTKIPHGNICMKMPVTFWQSFQRLQLIYTDLNIKIKTS